MIVKTAAQQELQALHRVRAEWMATRTARIHAMRGFLQEHGLTISRGARIALATIPRLLEDAEVTITTPARRDRAVAGRRARPRQEPPRPRARPRRGRRRGSRRQPVDDDCRYRLNHGHRASRHRRTLHGFRTGRRFASWLGLTPASAPVRTGADWAPSARCGMSISGVC